MGAPDAGRGQIRPKKLARPTYASFNYHQIQNNYVHKKIAFFLAHFNGEIILLFHEKKTWIPSKMLFFDLPKKRWER